VHVGIVLVVAACGARKESALGGGGWSDSTRDRHDVLRVDDRPIEDEVRPLRGRVLGLYAPQLPGVVCSALPLSDTTLLTAAHCIDQQAPLETRAATTPRQVPIEPGARACGHGDCAGAFPRVTHDTLRVIQFDLGTVFDGGAGWDAPDWALAHLPEGAAPSMYMLSAQSPDPVRVCRSEVFGEVAASAGEIIPGDSGSPLVLLWEGRTYVVGVTSHREPDRPQWYFALLGDRLPWPARADASGQHEPMIEDAPVPPVLPDCN